MENNGQLHTFAFAFAEFLKILLKCGLGLDGNLANDLAGAEITRMKSPRNF